MEIVEIEHGASEPTDAARPQSDVEYNDRGMALLDEGRPEEAAKDFRKAIRLNPGYVNAHYNLGIALYDMGRFEEAAAEYREAIRLHPTDHDAHVNLANALFEVGFVEESITHYRQSIQIQPNNANAHYNLGIALSKTGKWEEAIEEYRKAIAIDPADSSAHHNLGLRLSVLGNADEAISEYREAIRLQPDMFVAHYNLGEELRQQGAWKEAVAAYRRATELDASKKDLSDAHEVLGLLLEESENLHQDPEGLQEILTHDKKAVELNPDSYSAHINLGTVLHEAGFLDQAIEAFRQALVIMPESDDHKHQRAQTYENMANTFLDGGQYDESATCRRLAAEAGE